MDISKKILTALTKLGFSEKEARVYMATLELGEATVQDLAKQSKIKRTSIYHVLDKLKTESILIESKRGKKNYYVAISPKELMKKVRENVFNFENMLDEIEERRHSVYHKPRVYFLYGASGFKHVWDMLFESDCKEYWIITEGENFLGFVKEKYILDEIIKEKQRRGIKSRQLIVDSPYAQKIIKRDSLENRVSRLLPKDSKIHFTEIITDKFVAFISPRWDNLLFITENKSFAETRQSLFRLTWDSLEE